MKKLFLFLLSLAILSSCQDDDKVEPETPDNSYRLTQITTTTSNGSSEKLTHKYQDNKLAESIFSVSLDNEWMDIIRTSVIYPFNNKAEIVYREMADSSAGNNLTKLEFENEKLIEMDTYFKHENILVRNSLHSYEYANSSLTHYNFGFYNGDEQLDAFKIGYTYKNNNISESKFYSLSDKGNWICSSSKTYLKSENKMVILHHSISMDTINLTSFKTINFYMAEKIIRIEHYYQWRDMQDWELRDEADYTYNAEGYLVEENYISEVDGNYIIIYKYEKGKGNMNLFIRPEEYIDGIPMKKKNIGFSTLLLPPDL